MGRLFFVSLLLSFFVVNASSADSISSLDTALSAPPSVGYKLGAGDMISIHVYDEEDLSLELRIGLSGEVSYPLLGDVAVLGLTPKQLEKKLTQGLKGPYLINPSVNVSIIEYRPFYVIGQVKKPGSYPFHPGLTVDKAISIAGGFTERASKSSIFIIHDDSRGATNEQKKNEVKLFDVIQPGDVVTVEQSFF